MKFLLALHMAPETWDARRLTAGHGRFVDAVIESGELITTGTLAAPAGTVVIRVRDGRADATTGPHLAAPEYLACYYLIDCEHRERALEIAANLPATTVEVRPVMFQAGLEM
ncbi:YciI family protein [Pseudonocardia sp. GCM10023141]|uniref:YciI family protein n=1 Tax=Pseudonocardia sp. GCM10023141 TaxID=3252653 RepID=UPI003609DB9C